MLVYRIRYILIIFWIELAKKEITFHDPFIRHLPVSCVDSRECFNVKPLLHLSDSCLDSYESYEVKPLLHLSE